MSTEQTRVDQDSTSPYALLVQVLHYVIRWIEESTVIDGIAGATLDQQATALSRGWRPTRAWARAVRAALYLADQVVVPLRVGESIRLELAERTHSPDFSTVQIGMQQPEHRRRLHASYHTGTLGVYPVALYRLYVMRRGAREILLSAGGGHQPPNTKFYVQGASRSRSDRMNPRSLKRMLTWCLTCAAPALDMAADELRQRGLGTPADIRKVVAFHLVEQSGIHDVASLLGLRTRSATMYYRSLRPAAVNTYQALWRASRVHKKEGP